MSEVEKITTERNHKAVMAEWKTIVLEHQKASNARAIWQLANTLGPFLGIWVAIYFTLGISWWLTLGLAILNAGFAMRLFIIFHDCGHGSFFTSQRANHIVGTLTGLFFFTSYRHWRWEHAVHHASTGHLDRRGTGDVWTLTVGEYLESTRWRRFTYRLVRNPFILFVLAPLFLFFVLERIVTEALPTNACVRCWLQGF